MFANRSPVAKSFENRYLTVGLVAATRKTARRCKGLNSRHEHGTTRYSRSVARKDFRHLRGDWQFCDSDRGRSLADFGHKPPPVRSNACRRAGVASVGHQANQNDPTQVCRTALANAKSFGIIPSFGQLTDANPRETEQQGRYVCEAATPAAKYTIAVDLVCQQLSDAKCVNITIGKGMARCSTSASNKGQQGIAADDARALICRGRVKFSIFHAGPGADDLPLGRRDGLNRKPREFHEHISAASDWL